MSPRFSAFALMFGNLVIGLTIMAPTGMIGDLAAGLGVSIAQAAFLITGGAVVLCLGSPLMAWATNAVDRRLLLAGTLGLVALSHAASALAPGYASLIALRLLAMAVAAIFTPQAAVAIALIVPEKQRAGSISFVFLGWSLAVAVGLPLVAWFAAVYGWRAIHAALAVAGAVGCVLVLAGLPGGLKGAPMSFASWGALLGNRLVMLLLLATITASAGQFVTFTYLAPLLSRLTGASPGDVAACFAVFGVAGFLGNLAATRIVGRLGVFATSLLFFLAMLVGASVWSLGTGALVVMGAGAAIWGLGFAASNSMQQARLALAVPALAGAAIALNSSSIYVGQAIGSAIGGVLFEAAFLETMGYVTILFLAASVALIVLTRPLSRPSPAMPAPARTP